jgi:hypothetical protein
LARIYRGGASLYVVSKYLQEGVQTLLRFQAIQHSSQMNIAGPTRYRKTGLEDVLLLLGSILDPLHITISRRASVDIANHDPQAESVCFRSYSVLVYY